VFADDCRLDYDRILGLLVLGMNVRANVWLFDHFVFWLSGLGLLEAGDVSRQSDG